MGKMTPQEVYKAIAADFKRYGITYESAAELLGYTNKQTIANILSGKKYMAPEQAKRFHDKCGYDIYTLMTGEGELVFNPPTTITAFSTRGENSSIHTNSENKLDANSLVSLLEQYLNAVCVVWGHPAATQLWYNYTNAIKGQSNSILAFGMMQNAKIIQKLLVDRFGADSTEANTDPVTTIEKESAESK